MNEITITGIARGIFGMAFLIGVAWLFSNNRKKINWKLVGIGVIMQFVIAFSVLQLEWVRAVFQGIANGYVELINFSNKGAEFLFGKLVTDADTYLTHFAFKVLPTVVFISAFTSLLYFLGILQKVVFGIAWVMKKTMGLSGAESLATAANVFVGQTEAPLVVKPYIAGMTKSEMLCLMVGGMASIAGGVMAAFISFLGGDDLEMQRFFSMHFLTASLMSAPAAIVASKILIPETEEFNKDFSVPKEKIGKNVFEAIANGTWDGIKLAANVGAMMLVFTAMIFMVNAMFAWVGDFTSLNPEISKSSGGRHTELSFQYIMGYVFSPIAWIIGVPTDDMFIVGQLLGEKTILNEFYAYNTFGKLKGAGQITDMKSIIITTYALCGFANFASIGIQIGGIGPIAGDRKPLLSELGLRALLGGTISCLLAAAMVGMFY